MPQTEAAHKLGVSPRTLSLWECDRVYPPWSQQSAVIDYLGYDPFVNPALGGPKSNKPPGVANLGQEYPVTAGAKIQKRRLELRKTRKELAKEIGVSVKTLWGWETDRHQPILPFQKRLEKLLGIFQSNDF